MVAAATKRRSGGGGCRETQIRLVSSSGLTCFAKFEDCMFSLSLSCTYRRTCGWVRSLMWRDSRGQLRWRGYLLCFWGFLGLMWFVGLMFLVFMEFFNWLSVYGFLVWIFVSIFFILFWWWFGVFIKLHQFCEGICLFWWINQSLDFMLVLLVLQIWNTTRLVFFNVLHSFFIFY